MHSLVEQITAASGYAMRAAALRAEEASAKAERQAEIRAKQWATRKAGGHGVTEALLNNLPKTEADAASLPTVMKLLSDIDLPESSISSALSFLVKTKRVTRLGEKREYRYYLSEVKKS